MTTDFSEMLPKMLFGEELKTELEVLPEYDEAFRELDAGARLLKLPDIYRIFIPNDMAYEIYHKLYSMVSVSMQRKGTAEAVRLLNAAQRGHEETESSGGYAIHEYKGVATGMTSATCIGVSGIGKTSCLQAASGLCGGTIETKLPYQKLVPVLEISCPFNCSFRSLCSQMLAKLDECLGTDYYQKSLKRSINAEQVMQMVCNLANIHIGVLVIDEIQMIIENKSGTQLYRMILQLINSSNICVLMCGTPECVPFFEQNPQMARRMAGLQYGPMMYDVHFKEFCQTVFSYQYTKNKTELTDGILEWMYEHSGAIPATVTALIYSAQEISIQNGSEKLDIAALNAAYDKRMKMLHPYILPNIKMDKKYAAQPKQPDRTIEKTIPADAVQVDIESLVVSAKKQGEDTVEVLDRHIPVMEVVL
ncbi:MAG: ATP-binding protein [Lachnospiraceae bacterium]|nr:ATP-binding protein [Lachnospiraceae bacterium]